jgi:hypothetical protein
MNFDFWTLPPGGCPGEENQENYGNQPLNGDTSKKHSNSNSEPVKEFKKTMSEPIRKIQIIQVTIQ